MREIFDVLHEYIPKQYIFEFPKFCNPITINEIVDIIKYTFDGRHKFFKPRIPAIFIYK